MALEKPVYEILKRERQFELRQYDPYISSQVEIAANDTNEAATRGFRLLANYIFGGNTKREKISMTSPVSTAPHNQKIAMTAPVTVTGSGTFTVEFVVPRKFTMETLPIPNDERVRFFQHPARKIAAVRFSGRFIQKNFDRHIRQLREWMDKEGLEEKGEPVIAGYDPPFLPGFLKHNEVLIEVP